ncbi:MAG TPA: RNA polymerase sigma factor [Candidatus Saccharibacteria bacterium]|nr:RNA polymerase sigma factor [Candidatus Saccharibacteria bacterium]
MNKEKIITDEDIVLKVTNGDIDAYGELMFRYEQKLLRYVIYLTRDQISTMDVVQDTFIKAYQNIRGFNPKFKFSSWIYRIAHNEAMNALKKERHINRNIKIESVANNDSESEIIKKIDRAILNNNLKICLDELDNKYREILMLQYFENMKYSEISDILRIPIATVGVRSARAKAILKKICQNKGVNYEI